MVMYIDVVPNRSSPPAVLLRESFRKEGKVYKRTLANLSALSPRVIERVRRALRDEPTPHEGRLHICASLPHGAVHAILGTLRKLGLDKVIAARPSHQRNIVVAMLAARLLFPTSKLDTTRRWKCCTLARELGVADATADDLYAALDWLLTRQHAIERKLAARHLGESAAVLYDLSSSFYHGQHCPLAQFGHSRDGRKGLPIIVYGVLANRQGCPVAVEVYAGNTADPTTVLDQVHKLQQNFGLQRVIITADRGCITGTNIALLREFPALGWIGALRRDGIRKLVEQQALQLSLFDRQNRAEIQCPDYPGERLVACLNPLLAQRRRQKREALLAATETALSSLAAQVDRVRQKGRPMTDNQIGVKVGRQINHYKVAKHFQWRIEGGSFHFQRRQDAIDQEQALDGIYVIRTSEPPAPWPAEAVVRGYKQLAQVERAFRCLKGVDLKVRPIWLRKAEHVKAHVLLCLLAYYVEWHLRERWQELLFADEELEQARDTRAPVLPPAPSASVLAKKNTLQTATGLPVQSFGSLLEDLGTLTENTCVLRLTDSPDGPARRAASQDPSTPARPGIGRKRRGRKAGRRNAAPAALAGEPTFTVLAEASPLQQRALELLGLYPVR